MGPPLALVVCAAPLATRAADVALAAQEAGWDVHVIATPDALGWIDAEAVRDVTGAPPTTEYRHLGQPKRDRPVAVLVCPMTFNTGNKLAGGIADNYALGILCEALGAGRRLVAVPMVNANLWGHPTWRRSVEQLTSHVTWVDIHDGTSGHPRHVASGSGAALMKRFDPAWAIRALGHPGHG